MTVYPNDKRVRYSPSLHVWTVDTRSHHTGDATEILTAMLAYAADSGDMPNGCTCAPESFSISGMTGVTATPPRVHGVIRRGALAVYGHGQMAEHGVAPEVANASQCPLADAAGEAQARELVQTGRLDELWSLTEPFPAAPGVLEPAAPGTKPPAVWTGEPLSVPGVGTIPDRHVHAATRADLARLASMAEQADRLSRAAGEARAEADAGPTAVRTLATEAAMAGKALDATEVARIIRERQEAAVAAQAVAEGTQHAVTKVRQEVADGIADRQAEWLVYLAAQAAHGLSRLDAAVAELAAAVENLAEIDRVRQAVEQPTAGRLFSGASFIAGNAVEAARDARERAAAALAGLARHAAKVSKDKASQKA